MCIIIFLKKKTKIVIYYIAITHDDRYAIVVIIGKCFVQDEVIKNICDELVKKEMNLFVLTLPLFNEKAR